MLPKSTIIAKNWLLKIELFDNFWRILLKIKTVENKRQIAGSSVHVTKYFTALFYQWSKSAQTCF